MNLSKIPGSQNNSIKRLNSEINQCLLKNFAKPGVLIFSSCLTRTMNYTHTINWHQHSPRSQIPRALLNALNSFQLFQWPGITISNSHEPSYVFSEFKQTVKQQIAALGSSNKTAYKFFRDKVKLLPVKQQLKWCDILQLPFDAIDWSTIYQNIYYAANETKLRSFQIWLNFRSIVTDVQLFVLDIAFDNLCTFCREESETLIHLFCDCKIVDAFWNEVFDWILARFRINVPLNNFHKLFGFHVQYVNNNQLVNLMLLSARFLIYPCKYSKTTSNMLQVLLRN